jgi:hypothetical protein
MKSRESLSRRSLLALAAAAPLAVASVVLGVLGLLGSGWVGLWTHRLDVARAVSRRR